jgi:Protein trafficking PGA2
MSSTTETGSFDPAIILQEIVESVSEYVLGNVHDFQDWIARPRIRHWLRISAVVIGYILIRPAIELFFKKVFEGKNRREAEERKKKQEEEDEKLIAEGLKKPKKDGNSLRVGRDDSADASTAGEEQKKEAKAVVGNKGKDEKNNKNTTTTTTTTSTTTTTTTNDKHDEYEDSDAEEFAEKIRASGVLEWGRDARKKQKKGGAAAKVAGESKTEEMDEEKLMELLDWSDDEEKLKEQ